MVSLKGVGSGPCGEVITVAPDQVWGVLILAAAGGLLWRGGGGVLSRGGLLWRGGGGVLSRGGLLLRGGGGDLSRPGGELLLLEGGLLALNCRAGEAIMCNAL